MMLLTRIRSLSLAAALLACQSLAQAQAQAQAPGTADVARFFRSVQVDDASTVRKMLAASIDPNQVNPVGGEPGLVLAAREGAMRVVDVLLAQPGINLEAQAVNGNTALMMAAYQHNGKLVKTLLARGASVTQPGWTALHYAASVGDDAIARQLLEHGAGIDATSPHASGAFTPLMMAVREGHDRTVQLLLQAGANPALKNSEGLDAAQIAERADKPAIAAMLRGHGRHGAR